MLYEFNLFPIILLLPRPLFFPKQGETEKLDRRRHPTPRFHPLLIFLPGCLCQSDLKIPETAERLVCLLFCLISFFLHFTTSGLSSNSLIQNSGSDTKTHARMLSLEFLQITILQVINYNGLLLFYPIIHFPPQILAPLVCNSHSEPRHSVNVQTPVVYSCHLPIIDGFSFKIKKGKGI